MIKICISISFQVVDYGWPDHLAPPLERLCSICKAIDSWLGKDINHVVVVHCKGGRGRIAVVIAAYMRYSNICARLVCAFEYEPWRDKTGLWVFRPGVKQTSLYSHRSRFRSLIFWIEVEEKLYYLCSENKGADQLRCCCTADLRLWFPIDKNWVFS